MTSDTTGVNVHSFTDIGGAVDLSPYVATSRSSTRSRSSKS